VAVSFTILALSAMIGTLPILRQAEDFFINGIQYDMSMKLFIGKVDKTTHLKVFKEYFGRIKNRVLSWDLTRAMVSEMFSHDPIASHDYTKNKKEIGFYGNDGVCLFKYFIRNIDSQRTFVFSILVLNFVCFAVISICYIAISILSKRSSNMVSSRKDKQSRQRNKRMNQKISFIILTDFLCWVPFIICCSLHYFEVFNATQWYSLFSMIILPINSVINPWLYYDVISRMSRQYLLRFKTGFSSFTTSLTQYISSQNVSTTQEEIRMQEVRIYFYLCCVCRLGGM
jgi:hypothetical protein